jgi:hypothetical protein
MSKIKTPFKKNIKTHKMSYVKQIVQDTSNIIHLDKVPEPDYDMAYRTITIELIKYFDAMVRHTPEYRLFIQFVKTHLDVNQCSFYEDFSMENGFTIELHHHPFSLFDLCEAVTQKHFEKNGYVETFFIVEEVLLLHYKFYVGLTPLNPTSHDLVHNGVLPIHPKIVIGEWKTLFNEYLPYLSKTAITKYDALIEMEHKEAGPSFPAILEFNPLKIQVDTVSRLINIEKLDKLMVENKIKKVKQITIYDSNGSSI